MNPPTEAALAPRQWNTRALEKARRMKAIDSWLDHGMLKAERIVDALETLILPGDRIALEGNNQKQADFLSRSLAKVDPTRVHDVHLLISSISRPEHLTLFERGIARKVDFAFAGPQSLRVAQLLEDGLLDIGAIHTYVELYARMFIDLTPQVALVCAVQADRDGNLYTGANTEDTPTIVEATAFRDRRCTAACRYPRVMGRHRRASRPPVCCRTFVHPRSASYRRIAGAHGHDEHSRHL
jgi:malonate decarboxylase alpha subunit